MKRIYNQPEVQVAHIASSSIICASGGGGGSSSGSSITGPDPNATTDLQL